MINRLLGLLFLIILPFIGISQNIDKYRLNLKSRTFVPSENVATFSRAQSEISKTKFQNKFYWVLQFEKTPTEVEKESMSAKGIKLLHYIPHYAYIASVSSNVTNESLQKVGIRSVIPLTKEDKTFAAILANEIPAYAIKENGKVDLVITTFERLEASAIKPLLAAKNYELIEATPSFSTYTIRVKKDVIKEVADLPFVLWVEYIMPPIAEENTLGRTLHRASILNDGVRNLRGNGMNIGIWDGGAIGTHMDFGPTGRVTNVQNIGASEHGTHCGGTITSRGIINPNARGMAPDAKLYSWDFNGNILSEMEAGIPTYSLAVSSHSYGLNTTGIPFTCNLSFVGMLYDSYSRSTDLLLNNFPNHLMVHSSGNSGNLCTGGLYTLTGIGKPAKNNLVVGNITSTETINSTSSGGPTSDGRLKPEVVAFGTNVLSTLPNNSYANYSGTSMATPGVSGTSALIYERYKQLNSNNLPPSSLIKNVILNTATDLGNPGPDYVFGYGRLDALKAVKLLENNRYVVNNISHGNNFSQNITIPANTVKLNVMLTWNDPAAAANAADALVNDLDLSVVNPSSATVRPWILNKFAPYQDATRGVDNYSNVEQVTINNPAAGTYTLNIDGTNIPQGPQTFTLTWWFETAGIEIIYPNGGESFAPSTSEMITWNTAGITGTQTIEYSSDNGANWSPITTVNFAVTRYNWNVPASLSGTKVLIRVRTDDHSDQSDAQFNVLATPATFSFASAGCSGNDVQLSWSGITNATHYDIYQYNTTLGDMEIIAADVAATSFLVTGITSGTTYWFAIRAKNNSLGVVSPRSIARSYNATAGGGALGAIGTINGPTSVCKSESAVNYSIAAVTNATTYTWSVPAGATIVSGQNSTSIVVNFNGANAGGNISVAVSNATCSAPAVTKVVAVTGLTTTAPTSGGNQSITVCPGSTVPNLLATATTVAGHTIVWYTAATGGTIVTNPTLNAHGSVTYYAASRETASGCESVTRTAVTLSLNVIPAATVTASRSLTLCQGETVTLTANEGDSYLWSNGATSRSITVNTAGNYTVKVTKAGCESTSVVNAVVVNPLPAITVNASGPLNFCEGNSVTLTSNTQNSYAWSNGATSQAITVTSSGNYSVTATSAAGCTNTSAVANVSVSPRPQVNLSVSPYTSLYPGLTTTLQSTVTPQNTYTYTWRWNGNSIGGNTPTLPVNSTGLGTYTVTVSTADGCTNISNEIIISDSASSRLFIYPNPNNGLFNISFHAPTNNTHKVVIYDAKGAMVYQKDYAITAPYQLMQVDISKYPKGVYFVKLYDRDNNELKAERVLIH